MRLVTSMMTTKEMSEGDIATASTILQNKFNSRLEIKKFKYDDRMYYEVDIDLFDVLFSKENIHDELKRLIIAYEEIMSALTLQIDFISANDDTETEILRYEADHNDIKDFGLFVTSRRIPNLTPYYSSNICNAYVNLTYVSFGVYYF